MYTNDDECKAAGLDREEVEQIAAGLSRYARKAAALGLTIFGGSGTGSLRYDDGGNGNLVVAELRGLFNGGDGAERLTDDGYLRGE
jgi:hypothetical protein